MYPLQRPTEYRPGRRTVQPSGTNFEAVGVDGSVDGGFRRLNGMRTIHTLTGSLNTETQEINGFFPIVANVSYDNFMHGYIYRVYDATTGEAAVFLEYKFGGCSNWIGPVNMLGTQVDEVLGTGDMHVEVVGRYVYVMIKGRKPFLFYFKDVE